MSTELLKIAFMRGVRAADREVGITLEEHLAGLRKTAGFPYMGFAMPAAGAALGALAMPGKEEQGLVGGALLGLAPYLAGRKILQMGQHALKGGAQMLKRAPTVAPGQLAENISQAAKSVAGKGQVPGKVMNPAWKSGLIGAGAGLGAGALGSAALRGNGVPQVSPEEQQMLDQYRLQQQQAAQAQQMGLMA